MKQVTQKLVLGRRDIKAKGVEVSNVTLLRWESMGRFPRRIRMAGTRVGWLASEFDQWLHDRSVERAKHHYADASY